MIPMSVLSLGILSSCQNSQNTDSKAEHQHAPQTSAMAEHYTCPMHPHVKMDKPGSCPICHMPLVKVTGSNSENSVSKENSKPRIKFYRHPMNPSITSPVPAKDDMGMDYIPVFESSDDSTRQDGSIEGRSSVTLNSNQWKATGTQLIAVQAKDIDYEIEAPGRALSSSQISIQIFEQDLSLIKRGLKVKARSPLLPDQELEGQVTSIDSFLDPMTRTARVNAVLKNSSPLQSESSLIARIIISLPNRLVIPESAVLHTGKQDLVFVQVSENTLKPRAIILGVKSKGEYEVLAGLSKEEKIATGPNFLLDSEAQIRGLAEGERK